MIWRVRIPHSQCFFMDDVVSFVEQTDWSKIGESNRIVLWTSSFIMLQDFILVVGVNFLEKKFPHLEEKKMFVLFMGAELQNV